MKNKRQLLATMIAVLISITSVAVIVTAATTVGNDISIGGDLDIVGTDLQATTGALNISKSGSLTTIEGALNVDEAVTLDSTLTVTGTTTLATTTATQLTVSNLTSGRIPIISINGLISDDGDITFSGDTLTATNLTASGNLQIGGNATTSGNFVVSGTSALATTTLSGDLDLNLKQIKNVVLEKLSNFPSSPVEGQMFWSTASGTPYWYTGSRWKGDISAATLVVAASNSKNKEKADYIADGNDDQVEIKAAIDALPDTGGRVLLLEGTYYINSQILISDTVNNDYVTLEGQGLGTILKVPDGHSTTMHMILAYGSSRTLNGIQVKNLRIDGNRSNVTGTYYIGVNYNNVTDSVIDGVFLSNGRGSGGDGYGYFVNNSTNITIRDCVGRDWDLEPMEIRASSRILVTGCRLEYRIELYDNSHYVTFTNNTFIDMELWVGTDTSTGSYSKQIKINDNYFYTTTDRVGGYAICYFNRAIQGEIVGNQFYVNGASGNAIVANYGGYHLVANNYIYLAKTGATGIYGTWNRSNIIGNYFYHDQQNDGIGLLDSTFNNITNNYSYNPDPSNYGTRMVSLGSNSNSNIIKGNVCNGAGDCIYVATNNNSVIGNQVTGSFNRGINLLGNTNRVVDNDISGTIWGAAISNSGTGNIFSRNIGYATENSGTATISSGNTYVDVSHGLNITPATSTINVVPTNNLGNATKFWISNVGSSTFRINVDADPGVSTATFNWQIGSY